jgi:hypothetical protein
MLLTVVVFVMLLARTLSRILEWKYERVPWPSTHVHVTQLLTALVKRINEASGTYQMFSILCDVYIFSE